MDKYCISDSLLKVNLAAAKSVLIVTFPMRLLDILRNVNEIFTNSR